MDYGLAASVLVELTRSLRWLTLWQGNFVIRLLAEPRRVQLLEAHLNRALWLLELRAAASRSRVDVLHIGLWLLGNEMLIWVLQLLLLLLLLLLLVFGSQVRISLSALNLSVSIQLGLRLLGVLLDGMFALLLQLHFSQL